MFDSLIDPKGREWQTKAFDRELAWWRVGDTIPNDCLATFQVEIYGGGRDAWRESYATVRDNVLIAVDAERDPALPLIDWAGTLVATRHTAPADGGKS